MCRSTSGWGVAVVALYAVAALLAVAACGRSEDRSANESFKAVTAENWKTAGQELPGGGTRRALPDDLDPRKPVRADQLVAAVLGWQGREVAVVGYCALEGERAPLSACVKLRGGPTKEVGSIRCDLSARGLTEEIARTEPITVKGAISLGTGPEIVLDDCSFIARGGTAAATAADLSKPLSPLALQLAIHGWRGREALVVGRYHSYSKVPIEGGFATRIELTGPDGVKAIACMTGSNEDPPKEVAYQREGVVVRGVIDGRLNDMVVLTSCRLMNR